MVVQICRLFSGQMLTGWHSRRVRLFLPISIFKKPVVPRGNPMCAPERPRSLLQFFRRPVTFVVTCAVTFQLANCRYKILRIVRVHGDTPRAALLF